MNANGWSEGASLRGAQINEMGNDTDADQQAIRNGHRFDYGQ